MDPTSLQVAYYATFLLILLPDSPTPLTADGRRSWIGLGGRPSFMPETVAYEERHPRALRRERDASEASRIPVQQPWPTLRRRRPWRPGGLDHTAGTREPGEGRRQKLWLP